ncbi:hypothetical protein ACFQS6_12930 [Xanthomonas populi]
MLALLMLVVAVGGCITCFYVQVRDVAHTDKRRARHRSLAALAAHCGQAFAGRVILDLPVSATPNAFADKPLVMHVRGCDAPARQSRVPFHVGDDPRVPEC